MNSYEILGVQPTASVDELKAAFRRKAKLCHPDVREDKERAAVEFRELSKAYEHAKSRADSTWSNARKQHDPFKYDPGSTDEELRWTWKEQARRDAERAHQARREREAAEELRRRQQAEADARAPILGVEDVKIVHLRAAPPSLSEIETGSWERLLYLLDVPTPTDVYVHIVGGQGSITVKIPAGTRNGQRFRVRHPYVPSPLLTILVLHDKGSGQ